MCVSRFRDFRSRAARTYALDHGILVPFWPVLARDRPEINLDHHFKAEKVTLSAMSENQKSQGRENELKHWFISAGILKVANFFFEDRKIAKHT